LRKKNILKYLQSEHLDKVIENIQLFYYGRKFILEEYWK